MRYLRCFGSTGDALVLRARRRAAGGHGRRFETTGSVARPTGCHLLCGIGRDELLTTAPGVCRWRCCAHRCPHAGPHARALPTDDADREISALTKKIATDEASLLEDRKVILHHARSTSPAPPRSCLTRLWRPPFTTAHTPPRARQAKRELQLEIRQLRSFQKYEEAELKQEERLEKELEKSAALPTTALAASTVTAPSLPPSPPPP